MNAKPSTSTENLMHSLRVILVTLFAAAITTGATTLTGLATPAGAATGSIWQVDTTVNPHATATFSTDTTFASVSASGPDEVWAVGTFSNSQAVNKPLAEHWNGTTWTMVTVPLPAGQTSATLSGVDDLSPTDAWAVGTINSSQSLTLIEHWNGTSWSVVASPNPVTGVPGDGDSLSAIAGTGPNDLWAAGTDVTENAGGGLNHLSGVSADGPDDVWASGYAQDVHDTNFNVPGLLHWNGTSWTVAKVPNLGGEGSLLFSDQVLSPTDAWAVGQTQSLNGKITTLTEQFNGSTWSIVTSPDPSVKRPGTIGEVVGQNSLESVGSAGGANLFAVGLRGGPQGQCCERTLAISTTQGGELRP